MLLVLGSVVSVQVGQALGKGLIGDAGPLGIATLRLSLAAIVLLSIWRPPVPHGRSLALVLCFGTAIAGMNVIYVAIYYLPLGVATGLQLLGPLSVALIASRRLTDLLWATLALVGIMLFYGPGASAPTPSGSLFALASGASMGVYLLLSRRAGQHADDGSALAWAVCWAAVVSLPFGITESGGSLVRPDLLLAAGAVALLSAVLPYSLDLAALRHLPPRLVGILESLEPAVAGGAGILILGEQLASTQWLAILCITTASAAAVATTPRAPVR